MEKYLMNPLTGEVNTEKYWREVMAGWEQTPEGLSAADQYAMLVEVIRDKCGEWVQPDKSNK